jgi:hypothetical protein
VFSLPLFLALATYAKCKNSRNIASRSVDENKASN